MNNLRKFFCLFFNYWKVVAKRGTELSGLQVFVATSYIFNMLRIEWEKNGWDIKKLKYLTLALDRMPDELNPYNFLNCQAAYLDELKNYYIKHNEWISIVFGFWKRRLYKWIWFTKNK